MFTFFIRCIRTGQKSLTFLFSRVHAHVSSSKLYWDASMMHMHGNFQKFNAAAEQLKTFTKRPTDNEFLDLYGLFKQANFGDNTTAKPGMFDLKGKAKWQNWADRKGMSQDEAKEAYIAIIAELAVSYS